MLEDPLVSVILPTFNRAHLLSRAIESVLAQTYRNLELIVVDDASTDETETVVKSLSVPDRRLRYLRCPENRGPSRARNLGLEAARGECVCFLDSDDEWLPHKLSTQVEFLRSAAPEVGLVVGSYVIGYQNGTKQVVEVTDKSGRYFESQLLSANCPIPSTWLARKECLNDAGPFDEKMACDEDWEILFRIMRHWSVAGVFDVIVLKHETQESIGSNWASLVRDHEEILKRHRERWTNQLKLKATPYFVMAIACCEMGKSDMARRFLRNARVLRPLWWKSVLLTLALGFGRLGYLGLRFARNIARSLILLSRSCDHVCDRPADKQY